MEGGINMPFSSKTSFESPNPFSDNPPNNLFLNKENADPSREMQQNLPLFNFNITEPHDKSVNFNIALFFKKENDLIVQPIEEIEDPEIIQEALQKDELVTYELVDGHYVFKVAPSKYEELQKSGKAIEFRSLAGNRMIYDFTFERLTIRELELLRTAVKAYILFLEAHKMYPNDNENQEKINRLTTVLKFLNLEKSKRELQEKELVELEVLISNTFSKYIEAKKRSEAAIIEKNRKEQKERAQDYTQMVHQTEILEKENSKRLQTANHIATQSLNHQLNHSIVENGEKHRQIPVTHQNPIINSHLLQEAA